MKGTTVKHAFSIEMTSKKYVRQISVSNDSHDRVLFEGYLGELEEIDLIEGAALLVKGVNGVLRMDLSKDELENLLAQRKEVK